MLLIAFAVALGAMIMNLPFFDADKTPSGPDCSKVNLELYPYLCYADNLIKISVRSNGDPIESLTLQYSDEAVKLGKIEIADSKIASGDILKKDVPYAKTGTATVSLIPNVNYKNQVTPCPSPALQVDDVPNC